MALELELEGWMGTYQVKREEEQRAYALQEEARGTGTADGPEEWGSFAKLGVGGEYSLAQPASCHDDPGESAAELVVMLRVRSTAKNSAIYWLLSF